MGVRDFYKVQAAKEASWGSDTAATKILYPSAIVGLRESTAYVQPDERRGSLHLARRSFLPQLNAAGAFNGECTFEDIVLLLNMALCTGNITTSAVAVKEHLFDPSLTGVNTPLSFTFECGDDVQAYQVLGVLATGITISGAVGESVKMAADLFGKGTPTPTTFTAPPAHRTVESVLGSMAKIWMDDTPAAIGSTLKSAFLINWEWRLTDHFYPQFHADGALGATGFGERGIRPELDLTVAFNSAAAALRTKFTAGTRQGVRISAEGSNIATSNPPTNRLLQIDGAYIISEDILILDERDDGETICSLKLVGEEDTTQPRTVEVLVKNAVATIT